MVRQVLGLSHLEAWLRWTPNMPLTWLAVDTGCHLGAQGGWGPQQNTWPLHAPGASLSMPPGFQETVSQEQAFQETLRGAARILTQPWKITQHYFHHTLLVKSKSTRGPAQIQRTCPCSEGHEHRTCGSWWGVRGIHGDPESLSDQGNMQLWPSRVWCLYLLAWLVFQL